MEGKKCFKCGIIKPLDEFYKHPGMADGHVNKCIDCNKRDVSVNYFKHVISEDFNYIEKERLRGRNKYHRLYKNKDRKHKNCNLSLYKNIRSIARRKNVDMLDSEELHHWNYNFLDDVIIVNKRLHKRFHKIAIYDENLKMYSFNNMLLNSADANIVILKLLANYYPDTMGYEPKHKILTNEQVSKEKRIY